MTRILLAEDDRISRVMLQAVLNQWGFKVSSVSNGREALDALMDPDGPSLAILDWMMPELTGVDVVKKIRSAVGLRPIHLILLTARSSGSESAEAFAAGADDHISKPYNLVELRARIDVGIRHISNAAPAGGSKGDGDSGSEASMGAKVLAGLLPLNQIAMGVVLVHPEMLSDIEPKEGTCDLDLAVRTALRNGRQLLDGRIDATWAGSSVEVAVPSEIVGQILLNTLIHLRRRNLSDPVRKVVLFSRHDTDDTVLVLRCDGPDLSGRKLEQLLTTVPGAGHGQIGGFGPYFSRLALESVGGSMTASVDPNGGVVFEFNLPSLPS
jgi:DNA-binding response OmpR family regulator